MPTEQITIDTQEGVKTLEASTFGNYFAVHEGMFTKEKLEEIRNESVKRMKDGKKPLNHKADYVLTHIPSGTRIITTRFKSHATFIAKKLKEAVELGAIKDGIKSRSAREAGAAFPSQILGFIMEYKKKILAIEKSSEMSLTDMYDSFTKEFLKAYKPEQVGLDLK